MGPQGRAMQTGGTAEPLDLLLCVLWGPGVRTGFPAGADTTVNAGRPRGLPSNHLAHANTWESSPPFPGLPSWVSDLG